MRIVILLSVALILMASSAQIAGAQTHWFATLSGDNVSPAVSTSGAGTLEATLSADHTQMRFTLNFQLLQGSVTLVHIHRGALGTSGDLLYFLSAGPCTSPLTGRTDPAPAGGATGFNASDFSDLQAGKLYVDIHTTAFPTGEIRGQLVSSMAVSPGTWSRIKDLFR